MTLQSGCKIKLQLTLAKLNYGFPRPHTLKKGHNMTRSNSGSAQVAAPQASLAQKVQFSKPQQNKALFWLVLFHLVVIASSNYLVQIPFTLFGMHTTWGAFTFPFIFLATHKTHSLNAN